MLLVHDKMDFVSLNSHLNLFNKLLNELLLFVHGQIFQNQLPVVATKILKCILARYCQTEVH